MKRLCAAIVLIILLAACCVTSRIVIADTYKDFRGQIEDCKTAVSNGEFDKAEQLSRGLDKQWQEKRGIVSIFVFHGTIEEIDDSLARLKAYANKESRSMYLSECEAVLLRLREIKDDSGVNLHALF